MKKAICAILSATLVATAAPSALADGEKPIEVLLDGSYIQFDVQPALINDRTMVPVRAIFEALGATVDWQDDTETVVSSMDGTTVSLKINDNAIVKNGERIELDVPAQLVGDRTLVPVRAISEAYGCNVDWNDAKNTVVIVSDNDKGGIASINGEPITMNYFNYCLSQVESYAAQSFNCSLGDIAKMWGSSLGETTFGEYVADMTVDQLILLKAGSQEAKRRGIELDSDDKDTIDKTMESIRQQLGSAEAYNAYFAACGSTEADARAFYEESALVDKLYEALEESYKASDAEIRKYMDENYVRAKHILFATNGLTDEDKEAKKILAEETLAKIKKGEDFDKLMTELGEDPGAKAQPEGYLFTKGEMVDEFEKAAFALKVGEVSGIVESAYGYHIIKRVEPNYTDAEVESVGKAFVSDKAEATVRDVKSKSDVTVNDNMVSNAVPVGME